jgi:hypothetical protein
MQKEAGIPKKIIEDIPGLSTYFIPNFCVTTYQHFLFGFCGKDYALPVFTIQRVSCQSFSFLFIVQLTFTCMICRPLSSIRPYEWFQTFLILNADRILLIKLNHV